MSPDFPFHPELLEAWGSAMRALAEADIHWLSDYRSIDLDHELVGLEVCAIQDADVVVPIARVLLATFPAWRHGTIHLRTWGQDGGWRVRVCQRPTAPGPMTDDGDGSAGPSNAMDTLPAAMRRFQEHARPSGQRGSEGPKATPPAGQFSSDEIRRTLELNGALDRARQALLGIGLVEGRDYEAVDIDRDESAIRVRGITDASVRAQVALALEQTLPDWPRTSVRAALVDSTRVWTVRRHRDEPTPSKRAARHEGKRGNSPRSQRRLAFLRSRVSLATLAHSRGNEEEAARSLWEAARAARAQSTEDRDRAPLEGADDGVPSRTQRAIQLWWTIACGEGCPPAMVEELTRHFQYWVHLDAPDLSPGARQAFRRVFDRLWGQRAR